MYNYYQQQPNSTSPINPRPAMNYPPQFISNGLKGHAVSSYEEVKASTIDFDGTTFYFPDLGNKKIYTKTIGNDGLPILNMYELKPLPVDPVEGDYITRTEFDQALARISELLSQKVTKAAAAGVATTQPSEPAPPQNYKEVF